jgi:hypothetical protein
VTFLPEYEAVALEGGPQDTVTGVWARRRDRTAADGFAPRRLLGAEFVVDASGRGSRAPEWLAELGYETPEESVAGERAADRPGEGPRPGTSHATALYAPPVGHVADFRGLLLMAEPGDPRQGLLHPVEGGRWSVTLSSRDGTPPPANHEELRQAAGSLRHPLLHDLIASATPLGPVYQCRTDSRWRHYEKLRRWPDQFLVVGDAFVALDPTHGHGMNLAVNCALVLDDMLAAHGTAVGITYRLRRALAHRVAPAWRADTRGLFPAYKQRTRYASRLMAASGTDRNAAALLLHLGEGLTPPAALRARALRAALPFGRTTAQAAGVADTAPPSTTHGPRLRRRRKAAAIDVAASPTRPRPTDVPASWPSVNTPLF